MRFSAHNHLNEAVPLIKALTEAGHELHPDGPTDVYLIDLDTDRFGYRELIDFYVDCGAVVLQYPHGAPASTLQYDCLYEPYEQVAGQLTNGQGEIDYLRSIGIERPAKAMGWYLCRQFPFRPCEAPRRVVFAPTHANADGSLPDSRQATNSSVFRDLLECDFELVVRHIGELEALGLWKDDRVYRYVEGDRDMTTVEIDVADCVVAGAGTYPCLAIARGVPAVMYGQFTAVAYGLPDEEPKSLRRLDKYRDIVRYPIDVEDGPLDELVRYACKSDEPILAWREQWLGKPFEPKAFVTMIEEWIEELRGLAA